LTDSGALLSASSESSRNHAHATPVMICCIINDAARSRDTALLQHQCLRADNFSCCLCLPHMSYSHTCSFSHVVVVNEPFLVG